MLYLGVQLNSITILCDFSVIEEVSEYSVAKQATIFTQWGCYILDVELACKSLGQEGPELLEEILAAQNRIAEDRLPCVSDHEHLPG